MQTKTKLLTDAELLYVSQAIAAFARANPEIPISKSSVQMLRAGVGVHHAGLIPVWKVGTHVHYQYILARESITYTP